jgi:hypothetical protein
MKMDRCVKAVLPYAPFVLASSMVLACGSASSTPGASKSDSSNADGGFPSTALSTFSSASKNLSIELRTLPEQPPHLGPGKSEFRIVDAATGEAADGLTISVATWMPVMGHECSATNPKVKGVGNGVYVASPVDPSMPGDCQLILSIASPLADGGVRKDKATSPRFTVVQ